MYNTFTNTLTYTVIDIRKTFEGCEADIRMIARRTNKWSMEYVDKVFHDIIKLAEEEYLNSVDIILLDINNVVIRATKFVVNSNGKAIESDRAGANDWSDISNTRLSVILSYTQKWKSLTNDQKMKFKNDNGFKIGWVDSNIDNSFSHLKQSNGQLYASKGYELQKTVYK
ncbi:MAG: hypothetical protein R3D00_05870 [Bacteroidia bacterium]